MNEKVKNSNDKAFKMLDKIQKSNPNQCMGKLYLVLASNYKSIGDDKFKEKCLAKVSENYLSKQLIVDLEKAELFGVNHNGANYAPEFLKSIQDILPDLKDLPGFDQLQKKLLMSPLWQVIHRKEEVIIFQKI